MSFPAITVVMPALNAAGTLRHAIDSLSVQSSCYEAILVDGGSRDDTVAIASAARSLRVVSAPGTSIYEALNRGIEEARAPLIIFLNADDTLLPGALAAWLAAFDRAPDADIARGWPAFVEIDAQAQTSSLGESERRGARALNLELLLRGSCAINSLCIRRSVFDRIGMFDTAYRLAADREWMLRAWVSNLKIVEIGQPLYRYLAHEGSSTLDRARRNFAVVRSENITIAAQYVARLQVRNSSDETREAVRRWYAAETAMLISHQLRAGEWLGLAATARQAFRVAPLWPLTSARETAGWLRKKYWAVH